MRVLQASSCILLRTARARSSTSIRGAASPSLHASDQPFRRGVNVLGYDPYWADAGQRRFEWRHFTEIRKRRLRFRPGEPAGVPPHGCRRTVSIPRGSPSSTMWSAKRRRPASGSSSTSMISILARKTWPCAAMSSSAFWRQVAPRYANAPRNVAFELLNEPHDKLDAAAGTRSSPSCWRSSASTQPDAHRRRRPDQLE